MKLQPKSLHAKLLLYSVFTVVITLSISSVSFYVIEYLMLSQDAHDRLHSMGSLTADYLSLEQDENIASIDSVLEILATDSMVRHVCVYDTTGDLIQGYRRNSHDIADCPNHYNAMHHHHTEHFHDNFPIVRDGTFKGNLHLELSTEALKLRMMDQLLYSSIILATTITLGFLVAFRLRKIITNPINDINNMLGQIVSNKDYSIRAIEETEDELGQQVRLFNRLLGTIEAEQEQLRANEERFRKLADFSPVGIFEVDADQNLTFVNQRWRDIHQVQEGIPDMEQLLSSISPTDLPETRQAWVNMIRFQENLSTEVKLLLPGDQHTWIHLMASPLHSRTGKVTGYLGAISDISELKKAHLQMENLALYDALTGLANRRLFKNRLSKAIKSSERDKSSLALMFLDMDHFKRINDSMGHDAGDLLLKEVAKRLSEQVRQQDTVSRIGGDEFTILLPALKHTNEVTSVAEKILSVFAEPIRIHGQDIQISMSIGVTLAPKDSTDANILMKNADLAMYRAKELGRNNIQFFSEDLNREVIEHLAWEKELSLALDEQQFSMVYQPQFDIATATVTGLEALLRWKHPDKGFVRPDIFIPIAEETGHILAIGHWVIQQSCKEYRQMQQGGKMPLNARLAVNLSARQFNDPKLEQVILDALRTNQLSPNSLELEITESTLMIDVEQAIDIMNRLKKIGIRFAIDDFGTGYSSLSYLKRFPIDVLKVDRSFVMDIPDDKNDMAITAAVIAMAHKLGILVVAEGVETREHLKFLYANHCDRCQGYLFSRPLNFEQLQVFLHQSLENDLAMPGL